MFNFIGEEMNKVNATETYSDFEVSMLGEIAVWRTMQEKVFDTWEEAVCEFWKDKGVQ